MSQSPLTVDPRVISHSVLSRTWGLWVNTGGWRHHKHIALEPTTGRFDQLARSVRDGSAGRVRPLGRAAWRVRLTSGKI